MLGGQQLGGGSDCFAEAGWRRIQSFSLLRVHSFASGPSLGHSGSRGIIELTL